MKFQSVFVSGFELLILKHVLYWLMVCFICDISFFCIKSVHVFCTEQLSVFISVRLGFPTVINCCFFPKIFPFFPEIIPKDFPTLLSFPSLIPAMHKMYSTRLRIAEWKIKCQIYFTFIGYKKRNNGPLQITNFALVIK